MSAIAVAICSIPTACCRTAAAICAAACAAACTTPSSSPIARPARSIRSPPASTPFVPCSAAITAAFVARWMSPRIVRTCPVAALDCSARVRISCATTANPRPCSPARAASIVALSASRFDWSASSPTVPISAPICCPCPASPSTSSAIACTRCRISPIPAVACATASTPPPAASAARCAAPVTPAIRVW
jgi:hypothetical protein